MTALFVRAAPWGADHVTEYVVETSEGLFKVPLVAGGWEHRRLATRSLSDYRVVLNHTVREYLEWLGVPLEDTHATST